MARTCVRKNMSLSVISKQQQRRCSLQFEDAQFDPALSKGIRGSPTPPTPEGRRQALGRGIPSRKQIEGRNSIAELQSSGHTSRGEASMV